MYINYNITIYCRKQLWRHGGGGGGHRQRDRPWILSPAAVTSTQPSVAAAPSADDRDRPFASWKAAAAATATATAKVTIRFDPLSFHLSPVSQPPRFWCSPSPTRIARFSYEIWPCINHVIPTTLCFLSRARLAQNLDVTRRTHYPHSLVHVLMKSRHNGIFFIHRWIQLQRLILCYEHRSLWPYLYASGAVDPIKFTV